MAYEDEKNYNEPDAGYEPTIDNVTTITKTILITGNIESDEDLIIYGNVKGNISCRSNVRIYGMIDGNITCDNAYFDNAIIHGDINCSKVIELTKTSVITGNITAHNVLNGGRIKGDATVEDMISFTKNSAIIGNIQTKDIEIERGAVIQGNIMINQDIYFENEEV